MKAYESMIQKLSPTGLYSLDEEGYNCHELKALAAGVDAADGALDLIIREAFVATAEDMGLEAWEELYGPPRNELSVERRRELIQKRLSVNHSSFTPADVEEIIDSLGMGECTITENPALFLVKLDFSSQSYSAAQRQWIREQLGQLLPCHLEISVVFGNLSWDEIDSLGLSFSSMDNKNLTWDEIDSLEL